jgi:hypothetical protein
MKEFSFSFAMKEGPFEEKSGANPNIPSRSSRPLCYKIPKNVN